MTQHGLSKEHDEVEMPVPSTGDASEVIYSRTRYAACEWPRRGYADIDGYSEIVLTETDGPGEDEASGASSLDRFRSTCEELELSYLFGSQGYATPLPAYPVAMGSVIDGYSGQTWEGETPYPYPERDEVLVVRNSHEVLDTARCLR
jgi:hypothetical protein